MKHKKLIVAIALIAVVVSLVYLVILLSWAFGFGDSTEAEERMFTGSYAYLPMPVVALVSCVLLQVLSVRSGKKRKKN